MEAKFTERLIPLGATNQLGQKRIPRHITIHECSLGLGKTPPEFNLNYYIRLMEKPEPERKHVGYHYLVSDSEIIRFIPDEEVARHTRTDEGNYSSIGIERLVNEGTDFNKAISIQAKLTATLMVKWLIPLRNIKTHRDWRMDTNCPSRLLGGQNGGWEGFILQVQRYFETREFFEEIL
ncbi:MAG: peptidoglycan recognition protein family protein [Oscillospiraceae bacterium]|nr:peptidoglycan recognition protein family protein [Oscillospiraceae bacterium]